MYFPVFVEAENWSNVGNLQITYSGPTYLNYKKRGKLVRNISTHVI